MPITFRVEIIEDCRFLMIFNIIMTSLDCWLVNLLVVTFQEVILTFMATGYSGEYRNKMLTSSQWSLNYDPSINVIRMGFHWGVSWLWLWVSWLWLTDDVTAWGPSSWSWPLVNPMTSMGGDLDCDWTLSTILLVNW